MAKRKVFKMPLSQIFRRSADQRKMGWKTTIFRYYSNHTPVGNTVHEWESYETRISTHQDKKRIRELYER
ncbi:hypothetical protein C0992_008554, partial [Termitomyces sp. T32_za158]